MENQSKNGKCPKCKKCCKTVPAEKTENDNFEKDLKMLEYYQNEFFYRNEHLWKLAIKFFILVCIIALLPICNEILGISIIALTNNQYCLFFIVASVIVIYSGIILFKESKTIQIINDKKHEINKQMDEKYKYLKYHTALESPKSNKKSEKKRNKAKEREKQVKHKRPFFDFIAQNNVVFVTTFAEALIIVFSVLILLTK